jgi:hypothetical protein
VHENEAGRKSRRARVALAWSAAAVTAAVAWALIGASANAQEPCVVTYCIPLPTLTPTPTGTPFQNQQPAQPSQPSSGPRLMSPFPKVRTAGSYTRTRTIFTRVTVRAPKGAKIDARCSSKRCKRTRRTTGKRMLRLKAMQRSYRPNTTLTIRIAGKGVIGKYVAIRTRKGKPPVRHDRCLKPGSARPAACS